MALMLDADVVIASRRGGFDLSAWLDTQQESQFELAAHTVAELWHGMEKAKGSSSARRETFIETLLTYCTVTPFTLHTAQVHGRLRAELESSGQRMGYADSLVAAAALERGATLVTFTPERFAVVPGLQVMRP